MVKKRLIALITVLVLFSIIYSFDVYSLECPNPNGMCEQGENPALCPFDCLSSDYCGDGTCQSTNNEDSITCLIDCPACTDSCSSSASQQCVSGQIQTCQVGEGGCLGWGGLSGCSTTPECVSACGINYNCISNLCVVQKADGQSCSIDQECSSLNCLPYSSASDKRCTSVTTSYIPNSGYCDGANGETCANSLTGDCPCPGGICNAQNICQAVTYSCTGTPPNNALICSNDNLGLTDNIPISLVSVCGAPKCEYLCVSGYVLQSGACVVLTETQCSDNVDNDNDGLKDCADSDCAANAACASNLCTGVTCNSPLQCYTAPGTCSPSTGSCSYSKKADNTACTTSGVSGSCSAGICVPNVVTCADINCNDNNPCTSDSCSGGVCSYVNNALSCAGGSCQSGVCVLECVDNDRDGYGVNCAQGLDCDDNSASIYPGAVEVCRDGINQNCNEVVDDAFFCEVAGDCMVNVKRAEFTSPASSRFKINQPVQFAASGAGITSYDWDFGNGDSSSSASAATSYSSAGTFSVRLRTVDDGACDAIKTKSISIFECESDAECPTGVCVNDRCSTKLEDGPLSIRITSPISREYSSKDILLIFETNKPSECSYSFNNGNFVVSGNQADLTSIDGKNEVTVKCHTDSETAQTSASYIVKTKDINIFKDFTGNNTDSLFGDLKKESADVDQDPEQAVDTLTNYLGAEVTRSLLVDGGVSLLIFSIKNPRLIAMHNVTAIVNIPKIIVPSASAITSQIAFATIEEDPILAFGLGILPRQEISSFNFEIGQSLDEEALDLIDVTVLENTDANLQKALETAKASKFRLTADYDKGTDTTTITTTITPKKTLNGYSFIQRIPKCLAEHVDELDIDESIKSALKVLEDDPLVMWNFDEVNKPQEITYKIKGVLDEECLKQIESMGIADKLGININQPLSLWKIILPLLLIPLIGLTFVYFGKFHPTKDPENENEDKGAQSKEQQSFKDEEKEKIPKLAELKIKAPPPPEQANQKHPLNPEDHFEDKLKQHIEEEENDLKKFFGR